MKRTSAKRMRLFFQIALGVLATGLVYATAAPLTHSNEWWVRIFDFPRLQLAVMMVVTLGGYGLLRVGKRFRRWDYVPPALVAVCLLWQLYSIVPYTPLFPRELDDSRTSQESSRVSLLIANVLYDNQNVAALLDQITATAPDVVLLAEPTRWWQEQLEVLEKDYPYTVFQAQENHYGKLLYSRLELLDPEVRFLVEPSIPSIRTDLRLRSGEVVTLYGIHPRPPGLAPPGEDEREDSDQRDAELVLVAREVEALGDKPVIVAGDFNDVAWSHTTHLFQRIGGLLDPRVGRGLYNTFDVNQPLLRYPLDHVFVSRHFRVTELRRLPAIGSDHFPMLVVLSYESETAAAQDVPAPDAGDQEEGEKAIEDGREKRS